MSLFRTAARRDKSEAAIVQALRQLGWSVLQVSVKDGPDLFAAKLVNWVPRCVAIECKTGKKKLKPGQEDFARKWAGEYVVLRSVDDVVAFNSGTLMESNNAL
jgi:Holliday junction resolvase